MSREEQAIVHFVLRARRIGFPARVKNLQQYVAVFLRGRTPQRRGKLERTREENLILHKDCDLVYMRALLEEACVLQKNFHNKVPSRDEGHPVCSDTSTEVHPETFRIEDVEIRHSSSHSPNLSVSNKLFVGCPSTRRMFPPADPMLPSFYTPFFRAARSRYIAYVMSEVDQSDAPRQGGHSAIVQMHRGLLVEETDR